MVVEDNLLHGLYHWGRDRERAVNYRLPTDYSTSADCSRCEQLG
jgi:hypothetical protein